jgi:phosphoglycolate phosphatase
MVQTAEQHSRPRALVFDWDNTLVDTWGVIHDALNTTLEAFGHTPWTLDEARQRVRKSVRDRFPELFGDKWEDAAELFYRRYGEIHMSKLEAADGAAEMLEAFAGQGFYMAVVSNKRGDILRAEAEHLGWTRFFQMIVGATDAVRDKPAPYPIEMALAPAGYRPGRDVWYIGDADIDLDCAHRAGCVPVLVRRAAPGSAEFEAYPPAFHFVDCMALCKFMDNL